MYKYERRKKPFKSESYSCDYTGVYDTERLYCGKDEKGKRHLERPGRSKPQRYCEIKKANNFYHFWKEQKNSNIFSGLFRFIFACAVLTTFLIAFAIAVSVFDKGDEACSLKNYDDIIWPVVMQDPQPFDENRPPDKEIMLKASLWELAMNRKNVSDSWNEEQKLVLLKSDVESAGEKLFGKEVDFSGSNRINSNFYKFDDSKNSFVVEPVSGTEGFLPHTVNACHEGGDVVLKVGYISPKNQFNGEMNKIFDNRVEKYAKYRLKKNMNTGDFYVSSVT